MESNTFYYTFSTIPQVLGTLVALLAAFVHFRINRLHDYLIGDGEAVLNRWGETGYKLDNNKHKRLKDAVARKNIYEIKDVIRRRLSDVEKDEGHTKVDKSTGLQYLYEDRFCGTENLIKKLKTWTLVTVLFTFATITCSLICLSLVDIIKISLCYNKLILFANLMLAVISLALSLYVLFLGLSDNDKHEIDRK